MMMMMVMMLPGARLSLWAGQQAKGGCDHGCDEQLFHGW
jgi:hypothetical protein